MVLLSGVHWVSASPALQDVLITVPAPLAAPLHEQLRRKAGVWDAPSPLALCTRAQLGKAEIVGPPPTEDYYVYPSRLTRNRSEQARTHSVLPQTRRFCPFSAVCSYNHCLTVEPIPCSLLHHCTPLVCLWCALNCSVVLAEDGPAGLPPGGEGGTWDEALVARVPGIQVQRMTAPHFALWKTRHVEVLKVRRVETLNMRRALTVSQVTLAPCKRAKKE